MGESALADWWPILEKILALDSVFRSIWEDLTAFLNAWHRVRAVEDGEKPSVPLDSARQKVL